MGSDCAGLVTEGLALQFLGVDHKHLFVTEENQDVRHLAYQVLADQAPTYYKNVLTRDVMELPRVDLYVFGFPCQPFSPAGKGKGLQDERAHVLFHCLNYVKCHRPPIVVLENSHRLACKTCRAQSVKGSAPHDAMLLTLPTYGGMGHHVSVSLRLRFAGTKQGIIDLLEGWGYEVHWKILNTSDHGLPQSRPRFYLVAMRVHTIGECPPMFTWPQPIERIPLSKLLEPANAAQTSLAPTPIAKRKLQLLQQGRERMIASGRNPDTELCVIDLGSSLKWSSTMHECSPCLTASRCRSGGFYMTKVNRMMTVPEMCRLQGIPVRRFDFEAAGVAQTKFLHAVGNAMSSTVLARVLAHALNAVNLSKTEAPTRREFEYVLCP